jgi:hypothetical protein
MGNTDPIHMGDSAVDVAPVGLAIQCTRAVTSTVPSWLAVAESARVLASHRRQSQGRRLRNRIRIGESHSDARSRSTLPQEHD